jgi:SAM-dependent methyltransferase
MTGGNKDARVAGERPAEPAANGSTWPPGHLEHLNRCPVCSSPERSLLYDNLKDNVAFVAPGTWSMYRCLGCGAGYVDPRPTRDSIRLAYGTYHTHELPEPLTIDSMTRWRRIQRALANGYRNRRYGASLAPSWAIGALIAYLAPQPRRALDLEFRFLPKPWTGASVLDVGLGNAAFLERARAAGWKVSGVDIDPVVVRNAKAKGLDVREGGIDRFSDRIDCFDAVTINHVIEHVHHPVDTLRLAFRLLRRGGRLWIETPNIESLGHAEFGSDWRGLEPPRHLVVFSPKSIEYALDQAGFRDWRRINRAEITDAIFHASEEIGRRAGLPALQAKAGWRRRYLALRARLEPKRAEYLTLVARKPQ